MIKVKMAKSQPLHELGGKIISRAELARRINYN